MVSSSLRVVLGLCNLTAEKEACEGSFRIQCTKSEQVKDTWGGGIVRSDEIKTHVFAYTMMEKNNTEHYHQNSFQTQMWRWRRDGVDFLFLFFPKYGAVFISLKEGFGKFKDKKLKKKQR